MTASFNMLQPYYVVAYATTTKCKASSHEPASGIAGVDKLAQENW